MRLTKGKVIPRDDGKQLVEWVGQATTGTSSVSLARCVAPPGWDEPAQTPEFDELVIVREGTLTLRLGRRRVRIGPGEVGLVSRGQPVVYANEGPVPCAYDSVCTPAFLPELAHVETPPARQVEVDVSHPSGARHAPRLRRAAEGYLEALKLTDVELSLALVDDAQIQALNLEWRQKDRPTDVLSFPAGPPLPGIPGPHLLGDVVISLDTARRQARAYGRPLAEELCRYLAHGILHLLGHDHEASPAAARKMARLEEKLLGQQGMVGDSLAPERTARGRRA